MTINETKVFFVKKLLHKFEEREAVNLIKILLETVSNWSRHELILYGNEVCSEQWIEQLNSYVEQLVKDIPLQHILGSTEFYGRSFQVNENVLIPRPETEELVEWVLNDESDTPLKILDIGSGSGCIAITIQAERENWSVDALEIDRSAIEVISTNEKWAKLHQKFELDILEETNWSMLPSYDIIVSNPPYIKEEEKNEMDYRVTHFEPGKALFVPNNDPLLFYRKILRFAQDKLNKNGHIYFEIHEDFGIEMIALCKNEGFDATLKKDLQGKNRMIKATRNG